MFGKKVVKIICVFTPDYEKFGENTRQLFLLFSSIRFLSSHTIKCTEPICRNSVVQGGEVQCILVYCDVHLTNIQVNTVQWSAVEIITGQTWKN